MLNIEWLLESRRCHSNHRVVTQIPEERGRDPTGAELHMTLAIHNGVHGNTVYLVKVSSYAGGIKHKLLNKTNNLRYRYNIIFVIHTKWE